MKPSRNLPALLTKHEAQRFISFLYPPRKPEKMLALFRHLRAHGEKKLTTIDKNELERKIYNIPLNPPSKGDKGKRLDMLNHRLQKKITDFLQSDAMLANHPVLENLHASQVVMNKKWNQHFILKYTGRNNTLADTLLEEAIELAKKTESYSYLIQFLHRKRLQMAYTFGEKEINKVEAEIKSYEKGDKAFRRSLELYYRLIIRKKFSAHPDIKKIQEFVLSSIKELRRYYRETDSKQVLYYLKIFEMDFYQNAQRFVLAKKTCMELYVFVQNNSFAFTQPLKDHVLGNLAQCHIYMEEYKQAQESLAQMKHIIPYTDDWLETKELEFRIFFYQKEFIEAKRLLDIMQKKLPDNIEPVRTARLQFYLACILYMQNDFTKALKFIRANSLLHKDKSGWAVSVRMLELMILFSQKKKEECAQAVENTKRFLKYSTKAHEHIFSRRDILMLNFFSLCAKNNFSFTGITKRISKKKKLLSQTKGVYAWDPFSHELIRYDEWLNEIKKDF